MSFIPKIDPVIVNIKLTSKGREQLSKGLLNFYSFAVGDSEIDYKFNNTNNFNPFNTNILRPADKNPSQLSYITRTLSGSPYNVLGDIPSIPTIVENSTSEYGFFNSVTGNNVTILTDPLHFKQPDISIHVNEVNGGTTLKLYKSASYGASLLEPSVNDYVFIRWSNPGNVSTDNYSVDIKNPMPCLFYKIISIVSGSLNSNNLIVTIDKELPNFNSFGNGINAGAFILYNNYFNSTGTTLNSISDGIFSFFENTALNINNFPFWNMSIVFTEEIAGILSNNKKYGSFNTNGYAGFVSYIQNQIPINKNLGIIHYTNTSIGNDYGEELYLDTPTLKLPTIMWHNAGTGMTMGVNFKATGVQKTLIGSISGHSLNTIYYDLADNNGNVVGKVFNNLKLFVIEDQELLFAMSYKSNRSWTLPAPVVGFNISVSSCPQCIINATITKTDVMSSGGFGSIIISNLVNGDPLAAVFVEIKASGNTTPIYFNKYSGNTTIISNLTANNYTITLYDTSSSNCFIVYNVSILNNFASGWNIQSTPVTNSLYGISFSSSNNGWACGDTGTILHTANGGTNWTTQVSGVADSLAAIDFIDNNNGWISTFNGKILHTTNGGATWTQQNSTTLTQLLSINFININNGWACGTGGVILHTANGGSTWAAQSSITAYNLYSIIFIDNNNGWTIGNDGSFNNIIAHTNNGGVTWTAQTGFTTVNMYSIHFVDNNNGWAAGNNGKIIHTANGGITWTQQNSTITNNLRSVYFVDANNGWACGFGGKIITTNNGGLTWTQQNSNTTQQILSIKMISTSLGWSCGIHGTIDKYS